MNTFNIIADKIVFGGNCIGKINGKTVFIPFAVPGEKLEVEITDSKRDYDYARIVKILEPSPHRTVPPCPLYGKCGGCNMMHIDADYQLELRTEILRDCFARSGITVPEITVIHGADLNYRSRFQLNDGGLTERAGNNSICIEKCAVAEETVNSWFASVPASARPRGRCHLFGSSRVVSTGNTDFPQVSVSEQEKRQVQDEKNSKKQKYGRQIKKRYAGTVYSPADVITVDILGKKISFDVRGFFQSNMEVLEKAAVEICRGLKGRTALDMYAGCGTFSVFLSDIFESVTLVEHNRDALVFAEQNLAGKKHESYGMSGEKWIQNCAPQHFDAAVIDPPRSGMEKAVCSFLCSSQIPQIRSLSCDPATHARDAAMLINAGYKLEKLYLLDFYPHTSHIESLAWFCL